MVRADGDIVSIGRNVHLGHRATVHIVHEILPCLIGDEVTVGANAVVHACTVGDRCVIEDDVVILDDAKIADDVLLEKGTTVFPRKQLGRGVDLRRFPGQARAGTGAGRAGRAGRARARPTG